MEAARRLDEEPDPDDGRLSHLSEVERAQPPSEEYDVRGSWEVECGDVIEFVDRDPRPVVESMPTDTPLTEISGAIDFEVVAALEIQPNDPPESVISLLRESGMVFTDEGDVSMAAYQLDVLRDALQGNEIAFEELPEDNGLQQWAEANRNSPHAVAVFEQLHAIMHRQPGETEEEAGAGEASVEDAGRKPLPADKLVELLDTESERSEPVPAGEEADLRVDRHTTRSHPRRRDRIRARLRPLLGN